jgi:sugar-specific transcriptional regulator TrmB
MSVPKEIARDRIVSRLKELELSTHEALSYVTLLSYPNIAASRLCQETGIPDSKIYHALEGLEKKGMVCIQRASPNIYTPISPQDAISSLKAQLTEAFNEKLRESDALAAMLTPIYEEAEKSEELEIAYVIRGQSNIIKRMKALIESAKKEITAFIAYPVVLKSLKKALLEAKQKRKVQLNIALAEEVFENEESEDLGNVRLVHCAVDSLGMIITDMTTLLTISSWMDGAALLTQDQNLIQVTKQYYDNPFCCKPFESRSSGTH